MRIARFAVTAMVLAAATATAIEALPVEDATEVARKQIWAKELAIYAGRGKGQLDFYIDNASQEYLGWPPTATAPFPLKDLRRDGIALRGKNQEKITTSFKGFTLSGETAVIYYTNHRTAKADGTPVDQYYENIHVWAREGEDWKVLGGMSRLLPPK
jgi:hypothetical protein